MIVSFLKKAFVVPRCRSLPTCLLILSLSRAESSNFPFSGYACAVCHGSAPQTLSVRLEGLYTGWESLHRLQGIGSEQRESKDSFEWCDNACQ